MTRILLTGGSGFVASHILDALLRRGHSVVTTVRSPDKADIIRKAYPDFALERLDFCIVRDIAKKGAFDQAVVSNPPFEAVIHTASPVILHPSDLEKDLLEPAVHGTIEVLHSIAQRAPTVAHVVVTSSFAAVQNNSKGWWPSHTYTEDDWNPVTKGEAEKNNAVIGYEASKTFAEKAVWKFREQEKPNFTLTTICPPLVLGPILHSSLSTVNLDVGNQLIINFLNGNARHHIPSNFLHHWVDVRDLSLCHILAVASEKAANKRILVSGGTFSNKEIGALIRQEITQGYSLLPTDTTPGGDYPEEGLYKLDNSLAEQILEGEWRSLQGCIKDMIQQLQSIDEY